MGRLCMLMSFQNKLWLPGLRLPSSRCCGVSSSQLFMRCGFLLYVFIPSPSLHLFSVSHLKLMRVYCACPTPYTSGAGWDGCFLGAQTGLKIVASSWYSGVPFPSRNMSSTQNSIHEGSAVGRVVSLDIYIDGVVPVVRWVRK